MTNETVNDIICELREYGDRPPPRRAWIDLADRLDAANKRELKAVVDLNETALKTATDEVTRLRVENARLKAALKPVMAYNYKQTCNLDDFMASVHCMNIINEAQRIYNGGAE